MWAGVEELGERRVELEGEGWEEVETEILSLGFQHQRTRRNISVESGVSPLMKRQRTSYHLEREMNSEGEGEELVVV